MNVQSRARAEHGAVTYDCYQNVTEPQTTEYHKKVHTCTTQEL